ncbi:heavy metal transporter [Streptomyces spirodelae]|uniref:Heavy metal transporter n=1 Tax=Streptomyces spirodelae TaxID=2812904 RepID=A0ABS3WV42_9ACTN|nr:heavy metal transporter [Streptomyces spirodelae]MBO8187015.1 heavy metal transporter [Streptomyces spirodelae]
MPERMSRPKGRGRLFRVAVACVVLLAVAAYVAVRGLSGQDGAMCTVHASGGKDAGSAASGGSRGSQDASGASQTYELAPEQAANAATIAAVASRRGLPERAVTIALATAMQESKLRNIGHGDRDSIGLFQQRPSQGWGTADQIGDPVYSASRFYDHLVKVPGYSRLPLTVAAQRVQRSGFPQAYAKHEMNAALLTGALTGRRPATLSCTTGARSLGGAGDPEAVRKRLVREFGRDVLADGTGTLTAASPRGSAAPRQPRSRAHAGANSAARDPLRTPEPAGAPATGVPAEMRAAAARTGAGPTVSVPAHGRRHGWELAHWAVSNAAGLHIERISYAGLQWTAERSEEGWRKVGTGDAKSGGAKGSGGGAVELRLATGH